MISTPYIDASTQEAVITLSEEVFINGKSVDVLAADIKLSKVSESIQGQSAASTRISEASNDLVQMAQHLTDMIAKFKV